MAGGGTGGEFDLIAKYFRPLAAGVSGALSLTDDAAVLDLPPDRSLVATADTLVAGIHFRPDDPPGDIARKVVRVNLSDLAAMGASPLALLLAALLPRETTEDWLEGFAAGLKDDTKLYRAPLVGGDTVAGDGPLTLSLTALGTVPRNEALTRSGAKPGDEIFVTGTIGDGYLGLEVAEGGLTWLAPAVRESLLDRYRRPRPRLDIGTRLHRHAHAAIDISDGLLADLGHVCACSGVGARIAAARVPLSEGARAVVGADPARLAGLLGGGDDYELLFAAPGGEREALAKIGAGLGVPVTRIGRICEGDSVTVEDADDLGLALKLLGYQHILRDDKGGA